MTVQQLEVTFLLEAEVTPANPSSTDQADQANTEKE